MDNVYTPRIGYMFYLNILEQKTYIMSLIVVWKKRSDPKPYYTDNLKNHVYPSHARVKPVKMYILSLLFLFCFYFSY